MEASAQPIENTFATGAEPTRAVLHTGKMKAIFYDRYGSLDALELREIYVA